MRFQRLSCQSRALLSCLRPLHLFGLSCLVLLFATSNAAYAGCGDYLAHAKNSKADATFQESAGSLAGTPVAPPERHCPCQGSQCSSGKPLPLIPPGSDVLRMDHWIYLVYSPAHEHMAQAPLYLETMLEPPASFWNDIFHPPRHANRSLQKCKGTAGRAPCNCSALQNTAF